MVLTGVAFITRHNDGSCMYFHACVVYYLIHAFQFYSLGGTLVPFQHGWTESHCWNSQLLHKNSSALCSAVILLCLHLQADVCYSWLGISCKFQYILWWL